MERVKSWLHNLLITVKSVFIKFIKDSCLVRASGLAYSTLLAMVPFITIVYAFGGFDALGKSIESALLKTILPIHHETVLEVINSFTRNSLTTGAVGMIFFLATSIFLINTVARNFDTIWGLEVNTGFFRRYAAYTAILVFGSLLLGASTTLTQFVERLFNGGSDVSDYRLVATKILPYFLSFAIFLFMMIIFPSTKVMLKAGVIGGLTSFVLFELSKALFKLWVENSIRTSLIYGSIAIIPIFLVGLYLFWIIVLVGVEVSYHIQHERDYMGISSSNLTIEEVISISIEIFNKVGARYVEGGNYENRDGIFKEFAISPMVIDKILNRLISSKLLIELKDKRGGLIPGRSMDGLYLKDLVLAIYGSGNRLDIDGLSSKNATGFISGGLNSMDDRNLLDIINGGENEKEESPGV